MQAPVEIISPISKEREIEKIPEKPPFSVSSSGHQIVFSKRGDSDRFQEIPKNSEIFQEILKGSQKGFQHPPWRIRASFRSISPNCLFPGRQFSGFSCFAFPPRFACFQIRGATTDRPQPNWFVFAICFCGSMKGFNICTIEQGGEQGPQILSHLLEMLKYLFTKMLKY